MAEADSGPPRARSCLRTGCLGCVLIFGGILFVFVVLAGVGLLMGSPDEEIVRPEITRALPMGAVPPPAALDSDEPSPVEPRPSPRLGATPDLDRREIGLVVLDVSMLSFEVVAGPPGGPIRVEGKYDTGSYDLKERFERHGEMGWTYRLEFGRRVGWWRQWMTHHVDNRLVLVLPRDTPIVLTGEIGVGESKLDLGGLWIVEVDLKAGIGEHHLLFSEPLLTPMRSFELRGSIGEFRVSGLGNASPAIASISSSIGEFRLDLDGAWQRDAEISARAGIGEFTIDLPDDANIELDHASMWIGETNLRALRGLDPPREDRPTVRLRLSGKIGEMRVRR